MYVYIYTHMYLYLYLSIFIQIYACISIQTSAYKYKPAHSCALPPHRVASQPAQTPSSDCQSVGICWRVREICP